MLILMDIEKLMKSPHGADGRGPRLGGARMPVVRGERWLQHSRWSGVFPALKRTEWYG
jgi:hypothetical protein